MQDVGMWLDGATLYVRLGSAKHAVSVGTIRKPLPAPTGPWDGGSAQWDEFHLYGEPAGTLWVRHTRWEDIPSYGRKQDAPARWYATRDGGRTWRYLDPPTAVGAALCSISTRR